MPSQHSETVHATALTIRGCGLLLIGPSGSGKSDLALRCLSMGTGSLVGSAFDLVSDDQVLVSREGENIKIAAPAAIAGKLEVRGVGIFDVPFVPQARLCLVARLSSADIERFPDLEPEFEAILGQPVRALDIHPFEASAPVKLALALREQAAQTGN